MKKITILFAAALIAGSAMASEKRGVSENQFTYACQMKALTPRCKWYYNWGQTPTKGFEDQVADFTGLEFVPMAWNGFNEATIRDYVKSHPQCKYILGYNEPNFKTQSNKTPQQAASEWPALQALAKDLGLKLVGPALNYSPDAPYQDPLKWMDEFVALVGPDAFDYTAIHCYGGNGVLKDLATKFYNKYKKPVWVTEFCYWPGGAGDVYVSPAQQIADMVASLQWLEQTDFIYRYSWFKAIGASDQANKPNYGLLQPQRGKTTSLLTAQGLVYMHLWDFDKNYYIPVEKTWPATSFVNGSNVGINAMPGAVLKYSSKQPDGNYIAEEPENYVPFPIWIEKFTGEAYADYQFDVPEAGAYTLVLQVAGKGEPTYYDPTLGVYSVNADGSQGAELVAPAKYTLSGSDETIVNLYMHMTLSAGKQTIRLKDCKRSQPSGVHISTLRLCKGSGIDGVEAAPAATGDNRVYSVSGTLVREQADPVAPFAGLAPGIYIMNGRKYVVK